MTQTRQIKSKFAEIKGNVITLYEVAPSANGFSNIIQNVVIDFFDDATIGVTGDQWLWGLTFHKTWVSDLSEKDKPFSPNKKMGYKSIIDFFKGVKSPYVHYWYLKSRTQKYRAQMSNFFVEL